LDKPTDYLAFEKVLSQARDWLPVRLLAYCILPNHWHLVLWPEHDGDLSEHLRWLTHTHSMRWHAHYHTSGTGHIYQGRFKSFCVDGDDHLYTVARYVERKPLRANLVRPAEDWRWSSLWRRVHGDDEPARFLAGWPLPLPGDWVERVNAPQTEAELEALRRSVRRGCPFGSAGWQQQMAARQGLCHTLRPVGRPRKASPSRAPSAASGKPCVL